MCLPGFSGSVSGAKTDKLNGYNQPEEGLAVALFTCYDSAASQPNGGAVCVLLWHTVCQVLYFLVSFYISALHCSIVCGCLRQQFQRKYGQTCSSASKHLLAFPLNFSLSIFFLLKQQLACYSYVLLIQLTFFTQSFLLWQRVKWRRYKKVSKSFYGLKTRNTGELLHGLNSYDQFLWSESTCQVTNISYCKWIYRNIHGTSSVLCSHK